MNSNKEKTAKPAGITNEDLKEAIILESEELLRENREIIIKRAHKRLRQKFGR